MIQEAEVQSRVHTNSTVRNGIANICNLSNSFDLKREDEYINGITADFTVIDEEKIKSIIECKGGQINITDYVRGIGQLFQYEYFFEKKIPHLSLDYDKNFKTIYLFPSTVLKQNTFNVAKFKYPKSIQILELNEVNNAIRLISEKELDTLAKAENENIVSISQYYFRDNRFFEYYILLLYLMYLRGKGIIKNNRWEIERKLKKVEVINNRNWRNAFITLANLGLINQHNSLTEAGKLMAIKDYSEFAYSMYEAYTNVYFTEILKCFNSKTQNITNSQISETIKRRYANRDVLYLTQSKGRYISSWLNIMRDDFGIIKFERKCSERKLIYNPSDLNKETFISKIEEHSISKKYIDKYLELVNRNEI